MSKTNKTARKKREPQQKLDQEPQQGQKQEDDHEMESMRPKKGQPGAGKVRMFLLFYFILFFFYFYFFFFLILSHRSDESKMKLFLTAALRKWLLTLKKEKGARLREL
jgi:hypothetical protein